MQVVCNLLQVRAGRTFAMKTVAHLALQCSRCKQSGFYSRVGVLQYSMSRSPRFRLRGWSVNTMQVRTRVIIRISEIVPRTHEPALCLPERNYSAWWPVLQEQAQSLLVRLTSQP